jgi:protein-S-isoprenylcysteine O-methyltransferase Ste14
LIPGDLPFVIILSIMSYTLILEKWIRLVAVIFGLLVIGLPLLRLWHSRGSHPGRASAKQIPQTSLPGIFSLTIIYIVIGILFWKNIPIDISSLLQLFLVLVGSFFYFPGIIIYLWGFKTLGSMFGVSSSAGAHLYDGHRLIEAGPYTYLRHPMYVGVIMAAVGALLIFRTWAMLFYTPSAFSVILRARREEELLAVEFGSIWADYCRRVPAWLPRFTLRKTTTGKKVDH